MESRSARGYAGRSRKEVAERRNRIKEGRDAKEEEGRVLGVNAFSRVYGRSEESVSGVRKTKAYE